MADLQARIVHEMGDGVQTFALKCVQLENLEKAVGATIADIAMRVISFRPSILDVRHIIILGLEGGGMPPEQARKFFDRYVDGRPLYQKENPSSPAVVAALIMEAAWFGVSDIKIEEDESGNEDAAAKAAPASTSHPTEPHSSKQESAPSS